MSPEDLAEALRLVRTTLEGLAAVAVQVVATQELFSERLDALERRIDDETERLEIRLPDTRRHLW